MTSPYMRALVRKDPPPPPPRIRRRRPQLVSFVTVVLLMRGVRMGMRSRLMASPSTRVAYMDTLSPQLTSQAIFHVGALARDGSMVE